VLTAATILAVLAAGCVARVEATDHGPTDGSTGRSLLTPQPSDHAPVGVFNESRGAPGRVLAPLADGTTDVAYRDGTLFVDAGEPGSLRLVDNPGAATIGRPVRCTWHELSGQVFAPTWDRNVPVIPEPGWVYVLRCVYRDDGSNVAGYAQIIVYDPADPIAGAVVGIVEISKFAVDSIVFETPIPVLSPPDRQVVGVPTWLGVASRLNYAGAAAQAGDTWVRVRPIVRDAVWDLGDGSTVRCQTDIDKIWDQTITPTGQSTTCSHNFERGSGSVPFAGKVTVSWTIFEINNTHPNTWRVWGVVERTSPVRFDVGELQSVIR